MAHPTRRSWLDPIPLPARADIGRGAAVAVGLTALVGGVVASRLPGSSLVISLSTIWVLILAVVAICSVVVFAPWFRWTGPVGQELLLALVVALPTAAGLVVFVRDPATGGDVLVALTAVLVASALVVPLRSHVAVAAVTVVGATIGAARGDVLAETAFTLLVMATVSATSGYGAAVMGRAMATGLAREEEAATANRALRAVVDAARTTATSEPQEVMDTIVRATQHLQNDLAGMYVVGEDGKMRYGAHWRIPDELATRVYDPDEGLAGTALRRNELVVVDDYAAFSSRISSYEDVGLRAAIGAPIRVAGKPFGVLVGGRYGDRGYDPATVTAFGLLADHASQALELSYAIDEDRQLLDRLRSLRALQEDFVATVSHELRTPLTVIDGLAQTLEVRADELSEQQAALLLSRLRANSTALATILTTLLDAARLDRGLVEVEHEEVDLWELTDACLARLAPMFVEHVVKVEADDAIALGDAALLERVLDNLLTNAQRYTPPGTRILVAVREDGPTCEVSVSDDGPGIPPAELASIKDRFTRGGEVHTRSTRGLGLGLALADQILRLHGTTLQIESAVGLGSTFRFRLASA